MAIEKLIVPNHSTVSNAVDRIPLNPVRNPEIPPLNASFVTETLLLTINIKAALFTAISLTHETMIAQQKLPIHPNKPQPMYANIRVIRK
jgi:hypothetical protein